MLICYKCNLTFTDDHTARMHRTLTTHVVYDKEEREKNIISSQAKNLIINTGLVVKKVYGKASEGSQRS